jgi:putative transposase
MDDTHLIAAVRYVALNPVRARLAATAQAWPWSSVRAHLKREDDGLVTVRDVLERVSQFAELIAPEAEETGFAALRASESTGRPLGTPDFIAGLERVLGRPIARRAPGRKPRGSGEDQPVLP